MKRWLSILPFLLLLVLGGRVSADAPLQRDQARPASSRTAEPILSPATAGTTLRDGSFEAGSPNPFWTESSSNFGSPICSTTCNIPPHSGNHLAWFGGTASAVEIASLEQRITIPSGATTLTFWLMIGRNGAGTGQLDVTIDDNVLTTFTHDDLTQYPSYTLVSLPISYYANSGQHTLRFEAVTYPTGVTNFFVDDVTVGAVPTTIALQKIQTKTMPPLWLFALLLTFLTFGAILCKS